MDPNKPPPYPGQPAGGYGPPQPQPAGGYGPPQPAGGYPPPQAGYGTPAGGYGPPQPAGSFGPSPPQGYAPPTNVVVMNQPPVQQTVIVQERGVNHVLHFCISLFFWPWIIVWIVLCITEG